MSEMAAAVAIRQSAEAATVEYSIVALSLSAVEVAGIVKDVTGVSIDPEATEYLQTLKESQLEAIRKRLSEHPRWSRR